MLTRFRPSPALVVAMVALFVSLGSVGYAAVKIGTKNIKNGAVTASKLHKNAVLATKIKNRAVTNSKLAGNAVTTDKLTDLAVTAAKLSNQAVSAEKLADNSVTAAKLADLAVTAAKLSDQAVSTAKLADGAVTTGKLADSAVTAPKLACQGNSSADEMVKAGPVCIDKYEASVWSEPSGGVQYGVSSDDYPCADTGQDCKGKIYARSVAGVAPSRYITWFQAQQALANSGKRLPTNAEWQLAAAGTPDPGSTPGQQDCNTNSGAPTTTGSLANCVSSWGAYDMVGNVFEWSSDWQQTQTCIGSWPAGYGDDVQGMCGAATSGTPAVLTRGGSHGSSTTGGVFAVNMANSPTLGTNPFGGFRGVR